jgi:hypothetical protein
VGALRHLHQRHHALCNAHALRELIYVIDTAPPAVADLAAQGAEAMVAVKDLVDDARAGDRQPDPDRMAQQRHLQRSAFVLGKSATAERATKTERKYNSLFTRLIDRWEDYQRHTTDPAVRFDNNPAEQTIRMPKLPYQGLRLPANPHRRRGIRRHPFLHRHRDPPRAEHARRPHQSRRQQPLDPCHLTHPPPHGRWATRLHQHAQNPDLSSYG